jgi:hypothetical protein
MMVAHWDLMLAARREILQVVEWAIEKVGGLDVLLASRLVEYLVDVMGFETVLQSASDSVGD